MHGGPSAGPPPRPDTEFHKNINISDQNVRWTRKISTKVFGILPRKKLHVTVITNANAVNKH